MLLIKNAFAVLTFLMLSISSAQADYLTDLCDDLYAKIEDLSVGSQITRSLYQEKVLLEVRREIQREIEEEVKEFFDAPNGGGINIRTSGFSDELKTNIYLAHKDGLKKAKEQIVSSLFDTTIDTTGKHSFLRKLAKMSGGEKIRLFAKVKERFRVHEKAMIISYSSSKVVLDTNEFKDYSNKVHCMEGKTGCKTDGALFRILNSFKKSPAVIYGYLYGDY